MWQTVFVTLLIFCLPTVSAVSTTIATMDSVDDLNYTSGQPEIVQEGPNGGAVSVFDGGFNAKLTPNIDLQNYDLLKIQMKAERSAFAQLTIDNVPWEDKKGTWYFLDGLQPGFDWKTIWIDLNRPEEGLSSNTDNEKTTLHLNGFIKDTGRSMQNASEIWIGDIRAVKKVVDIEWNQSRVSYTWNDDLTYTYPLQVSNVHDEPVNATIALNGYEAPHATASLSQQEVKLAPGETTTVTATLTLPGDVADSAEPFYTERFRVTASAEGNPDSKVTVLRSADPIPLTVTVPISQEKLEFPILPTPSELPSNVIRYDESMARQEASRDADQVIQNAKENGIYQYNSEGSAATYRKTLIASAYLYDLTGEQKFLEKSRTLLKALPEIWNTFYTPYANKEKRLISSGIIARMGDRAHFTLGLGWRLMGTQRSPYQYGTSGNNARGSMSSIFYAFDMIAPKLEDEERREIINQFIIPAGIQSRNHLIGDGNQQATANSVALYAGLAGQHWPLAAFATSSDHSVHEVMDWTFTDEGLHIRDGYQAYTLRPVMWIGELLYSVGENLYNIHKERLEKAYSLGGDQYFWNFVKDNRVTQGSAVPAPSELTATSVAGDNIRLEWKDTDNEARYVIERSTSPNSGYEQIATTRRNTPVHKDSCNPGITYHYRVQAYNYNNKESSYSDTATATCGETTSCSPAEEICDGEDNDCDGLVDEGCEEKNKSENAKPTVSYSTLSDGQEFAALATMGVEAVASDSDGNVSNVTLTVNGDVVYTENSEPYQWGTAHTNRDDELLKDMIAGEYTLTLTAVDDKGEEATKSITISVSESAMNLSTYPEPIPGVSITASTVNVSDTIIHNTGYYYTNGEWKNFSLTGTKKYDSWIIGSASASVDLSQAQYVAVYSCSWQNNWYCHEGWQVATISSDETSFAAFPDNMSEWTERGSVLSKGDGGWDAESISVLDVSKVDNTYYLFYLGSFDGKHDPSHTALGVATSTDGETFQKHAENPVLTAHEFIPISMHEEGFRASTIGYDTDEERFVGYFGVQDPGGEDTCDYMEQDCPAGGNVDAKVYAATSPNGLNWTVKGLVDGANNADGAENYASSVEYHNGTYYLWNHRAAGGQQHFVSRGNMTDMSMLGPADELDFGWSHIETVLHDDGNLTLLYWPFGPNRDMHNKTYIAKSTLDDVTTVTEERVLNNADAPETRHAVLQDEDTDTWRWFYNSKKGEERKIYMRTAPCCTE